MPPLTRSAALPWASIPDPVAPDFAAALPVWRASAGLSQAALARLLGTSRNTVANWERTRHSKPPGPDLAEDLLTLRKGPRALARAVRERMRRFEGQIEALMALEEE